MRERLNLLVPFYELGRTWGGTLDILKKTHKMANWNEVSAFGGRMERISQSVKSWRKTINGNGINHAVEKQRGGNCKDGTAACSRLGVGNWIWEGEWRDEGKGHRSAVDRYLQRRKQREGDCNRERRRGKGERPIDCCCYCCLRYWQAEFDW